MKTLKKFNVSIFTLIAVLILSLTAKVNSQVIVKLRFPPPNQVNIDDLWKLQTITNTTQKKYTIYLHGTVINNDNGDLIWNGNSSSFDLEANYSGPVEYSTLEPVTGNFNNKYENAKNIFIRTGSLPAGNYTLCVYVINADNEQELSRDCIHANVAHPSPPVLISPEDGTNVTEEYPVFTWMPPMPMPAGKTEIYDLKIVEILDNQTPEEAMQSNPAWFEKKDIQMTSFQYPVSARKFEVGKNYGWQVICFMDPNLSSPIKSEVWIFQYGNNISEYSLKLLTPKLAEEIQNPYPRFSWSISKNLTNSKINYTLKIFEVDTSSKPIDYSKEKPFYEKNEIQDNFYKYSEKDRPFNEGKAYVWWVEANTDKHNIRPDTAHIIFWHFKLYDYGDAPDPTFPTKLFSSNGARHWWFTIYWDWHYWPPFYFPHISIINPSIQVWLGKLPAGYNPEVPDASSTCCNRSVDFEYDARTPFDNFDDGIYFFPTPDNYCQSCILDSIDVMVNRNLLYNWHRPLIFHAWFDWNGDGDWDDTDTCDANTIVYEHIHWFGARVLWPTYAGSPSFSITRPDEIQFFPSAWANDCCAIYRLYFYTWPAPASNIWTRFRLTPGIPVNYSISYNNFNKYKNQVVSGEVEDYLIKCDTIPPNPPDTTCQCQCDPPLVNAGSNLVTNGDFSLGNSGFTSGLIFVPAPSTTSPVDAGKYCITNDAAIASSRWVGYDHTSPPTGKFMVCNGKATFAWKQTVSVSAYTNYKFCFWVRNLNKIDYTGTQLPEIQPRINAIPISFKVDHGPITFTSYNVPQDITWHLVEANWFSGITAGAIPIEIWDLNNAGPGGNDFGIDDICFFECDTIPPNPPDTSCQCKIIKVHINGISIEEGDRIDIIGTPAHNVFLPVNRNFNVTANCGTGCSTSYEWTITKPDASTDTRTSAAFTYSFTTNGVYLFDITVTCSDGTTCSRTFSVNIEASGGSVIHPHNTPIK